MARAIRFPFVCTDTALERVTDPPTAIPGAYADYHARTLPLGVAPATWESLTGSAPLSTATPQSSEVLEENGRRFLRLNGATAYNNNGITNTLPRTRFMRFRLHQVILNRAFLSNAHPDIVNLAVMNTGYFGMYAGASLISTKAADTAWHTAVAVFNGASSVLRIDGVEVSGSAGANAGTGFRVGAQVTNNLYYPIDVERVGFLTTAADASTRAAIEAALS
ncbi:hypothetical protein [Microbacterium sp. KNMS]